MRIALVGKRAQAFVAGLRSLPGVRVTAFCEVDPAALEQVAERHGIPKRYPAYEEVLASDVEAVVVGTPMQLHVPQAVAALRAGKHVLSEVTAAVSVGECRELVAAVRTSRRVYMMAENYCYSKPAMLVREMARRGLFGELYYAEGAYIHDCRHLHYDAQGNPTWRRYLQVGKRGATYPTHSLGPVLEWLDDRVATVACMGSGARVDPTHETDTTVSMLCRTARGGLVDVRLDMQSPRPHNMTHYVLQGTKGAYVSGRRPGEPGLVWIEGRSPGREQWQTLDEYEPEFLPEEWREHGTEATAAGHGGGDFFVARAFAKAVLEGTPPPIDVDRAMDFTLPGLISEESIARGGVPLPVPDSRTW
ncbi:MAG TPA: Gfo/Idh/MocA family oxidoreductase [Chloroflexota bacterium]|jgi:predicted dehydrogenase|nr:Gfo/Idh/MocA family oxidoreductase [Chloroflexota bacterium]